MIYLLFVNPWEYLTYYGIKRLISIEKKIIFLFFWDTVSVTHSLTHSSNTHFFDFKAISGMNIEAWEVHTTSTCFITFEKPENMK